MSDRDSTSEDNRILRSARRPIAHVALGPEGDRLLFRQQRERQQQQRRARAAEASRAFASEAAASAAMATAAQRSSQASSSGTVGSTIAQTLSQSTGVMASQPLVNQLAGEANINMHNFPSFGKKALDLEAKTGHGQTPTTDGRRKSLPPNWKAKGRIMFVDNDGSTIELDYDFQSKVGSEASSVEASTDGVVVVVAQKVISDALKRWIEVIEQYDFEPQYLKGEYNKVVDALSRRPNFSGALITEFGLEDDVTRSLVEAYHKDQFMSEIIRSLEAKDKVTSVEFELINGLLFLEKVGNKRLFVPDRESLRSLFLGECHDATEHFGYKKTAANLLQRFWLPTMMKDAKLYVETCQGTQLPMTSENHPEANGQAEQMNRVVQHLLKHYIKPNQVDWDEKLALIASLYNNVVHNATGVSPNSLLLTFKPRLPLDFLLPENQPSVAPQTLEFAYRYERLMHQVVKQMHKAQAAMIESENKHRRPSTFQVGERVWVKSSELGQEHGISCKLMPQYFGPWEILDVVGDEPDGPSYVIRIPGHLRTYPVFHASKLAPSRETDQFPSCRSMLPPDIVDHKEMPVPRLTGRGRPPKPKLQYRVRPRHHTDPKEDRWFTREELMQTAPQVVAQYEKSLQKGKRQSIED
ncbi:hypothetical protein CBR_g26117 [Chara braunii]|uniref:Integrase catalytic domain-containing protein n=1 Tax=Chara braunii TaxID=69332 RepID=A0A388JVV6_CHABU|nr:hypothetical protein CBR_g26117 [Chara braunii]|eukprot:GBG61954.1 hypothetical protein CBR_g26117 [Chara braunii]